MTDTSLIRNFSIIAHIDHGKSTLSDRLIQLCGKRRRPRHEGADPRFDGYRARARHHDQSARPFASTTSTRTARPISSTLMDTPGHVDFAYEVSRSLAACEGAILVVDASQGVEAQTLANVYQALDNNLAILPS
ncbi:MAG: GTP-binding protein [Hyphomicrobium sp.]